MYEHIEFKNAINMRKANYDKFPSTKLTGMLVQGWDSIISMLKKKMDARKVLAVDLYTGVYEEEVLDAFSKEFSGRVMNVRDLMKPEKEIQVLTNNRTSYEIKERFHFDSQHITLVSWEQQ